MRRGFLCVGTTPKSAHGLEPAAFGCGDDRMIPPSQDPAGSLLRVLAMRSAAADTNWNHSALPEPDALRPAMSYVAIMAYSTGLSVAISSRMPRQHAGMRHGAVVAVKSNCPNNVHHCHEYRPFKRKRVARALKNAAATGRMRRWHDC